MYTHQLNQKGFTLVETLVSITILLLVVIGPMTIAQKGIQNAYYAEEQLTAVFLAQETVEAIREFRDKQALIVYREMDTNTLVSNTADWVPSQCLTSSGCSFDVVSGNFSTCSSGFGCPIYVTSGGKYVQSLGGVAAVTTPFSRKLVIGPAVDTNGDSLNDAWPMTVTVSWNGMVFNNATREVKLQTWIYDQYQRYED